MSIYGWNQGRDAGFIARHTRIKTGKGTIQLRPDDAAAVTDDEFRDLVRTALDADHRETATGAAELVSGR